VSGSSARTSFVSELTEDRAMHDQVVVVCSRDFVGGPFSSKLVSKARASSIYLWSVELKKGRNAVLHPSGRGEADPVACGELLMSAQLQLKLLTNSSHYTQIRNGQCVRAFCPRISLAINGDKVTTPTSCLGSSIQPRQLSKITSGSTLLMLSLNHACSYLLVLARA
jgi:hypothetical protein